MEKVGLSEEVLLLLKKEAPLGLPRAWFRASEQAPVAEAAVAPPPGFNLMQLREQALCCTRCRLHSDRKNVVFGVGNAERPLVMFVGEGPGAEEDAKGEPFVGKAGQLLTAAITKGMGMRREDVYIANVVKCRPPENRTPLPDEVAACEPFLFKQIELIAPRVLVALGAPAMKTLTNAELGITKSRGKWMTWRETKVMPTFHPAYILRNPAAKKDFWSDLQLVMKEIGLTRPVVV